MSNTKFPPATSRFQDISIILQIHTCSAVKDNVGKANSGLGIASWCPRAATGVGFVISGTLAGAEPPEPPDPLLETSTGAPKWPNRICSRFLWAIRICSGVLTRMLGGRAVVGGRAAGRPWGSGPGLWAFGEASLVKDLNTAHYC